MVVILCVHILRKRQWLLLIPAQAEKDLAHSFWILRTFSAGVELKQRFILHLQEEMQHHLSKGIRINSIL